LLPVSFGWFDFLAAARQAGRTRLLQLVNRHGYWLLKRSRMIFGRPIAGHWPGRVVSVQVTDIVRLRAGHHFLRLRHFDRVCNSGRGPFKSVRQLIARRSRRLCAAHQFRGGVEIR
jgi:hypothetical protein